MVGYSHQVYLKSNTEIFPWCCWSFCPDQCSCSFCWEALSHTSCLDCVKWWLRPQWERQDKSLWVIRDLSKLQNLYLIMFVFFFQSIDWTAAVTIQTVSSSRYNKLQFTGILFGSEAKTLRELFLNTAQSMFTKLFAMKTDQNNKHIINSPKYSGNVTQYKVLCG